MTGTRRRRVLGVLLFVTGAVVAVALADVLGTVFLAITVAYLLVPLRDALTTRGLSPWWASLAATAAVFVVIVLTLLPLVVVVVVRVDDVVTFLRSAPDAVSLNMLGMEIVVTVEEVIAFSTTLLGELARAAVESAPVLVLKLTVFSMVVFTLSLHGRETRRAVLGVIPPSHRDLAESYNERIRGTLFGVYVLQVATAVGTFLISLPVFFALGYAIPITLAVVAAVLQFIPIVGPSVLLAALAAYHLVGGDPVAAVVVVVVGGVLVAWLPDVLIRPRLARQAAGLSGTLYFVGFVGGILTLGAVGVVAGPLAIAVLVETASLLDREYNEVAVEED